MQDSETRARQDLENNIPYDYCRSCDSSDGLYHEYVDEDSWQYKIKMLLEEKDKEIERLNNNWNKLEKWLEQEYAVVKANSIQEPNNPEWYIKWNERKNALDKLQEIKGDDVGGD